MQPACQLKPHAVTTDVFCYLLEVALTIVLGNQEGLSVHVHACRSGMTVMRTGSLVTGGSPAPALSSQSVKTCLRPLLDVLLSCWLLPA